MSPARPYHHGDLRQVLIDTAIRLIDASGLEQLSVREVARAANVSPGAPFRHFSSRTALLTAVAEQAMDRLESEIAAALTGAAGKQPLDRYRAIGTGFLRWAFANPVPFQVISTRAVIDFEGSSLRDRNDAIRTHMVALFREAGAMGQLRGGPPEQLAVAGRAIAYGAARMFIDGQFPSWGLDTADPLGAAQALLDRFMDAIEINPG
jgi:AcrR family transcriptional regulator